MDRRELDWPAILRFFGLIVAAFFLAVGGFLYWAATHPGSAWKTFIQPRVFSKDTQIKTASASFQVSKVSWREWRVEWVLTGLEISRQNPALNVAANAKISGVLRVWNPITEFHISNLEFVADGPPVVFEAPSSDGRPKSPFQTADGWRKKIERYNRFLRIDKLEVKIREIRLGQPAKQGAVMDWAISAQKPSPQDPMATLITLQSKQEDLSAKIASSLRMDQFGNGSPFAKTEIDVKSKTWGGQGTVELGATEAQMIAGINGRAHYGKITGGINSQLAMTQSQATLKGKTDLEHLPGPVPEIKGLEWNLHVPLVNDQWFGDQPGRVSATGPVALIFVKKEIRDQLESTCKCKFPETLNASIEGSLWLGHILQRSEIDQPVANVKVKLDPIQNAMMQLSLNGQFTVIHAANGKLQYWPVVETQAKFLNFQHLKALLEANRIVVPSPFDILGGTVELTSKATVSPNDKNVIVIPADIKINLASAAQKIVMDANVQGMFTPGARSLEIYANLNIDDFIVELPPVDPIHGIPKIAKDPRLLAEPPAAPQKEEDQDFKVRFIYDVRTSKPGAVRLLSKLAKPAIPISVDVDRTKAGDTRGIIKSEPFELNYMHRVLFVDGLRLILDDRDTADFAVDGRLRMEQSQYKVNIIVSGTIRSPLIKLTSEPELGRSDIISVILYDRTTDQLVAADRETVGVFDTAVADRAIGLLGLWVFASTPIRSFHYNPATKVYTATVQLAEGTTASLGTDWEEAAQVEVRKRVTKRWVLTASWKPGTENTSQSGKLVLQWEKRF